VQVRLVVKIIRLVPGSEGDSRAKAVVPSDPPLQHP